MIINGGSRSNGAFFARHLTNGEKNERVTVYEIRGLAAETIPGALREMAAVAQGTLCKNYFYHANLNPKQHERLSSEQWDFAVDTLERNLQLEGHARFVVEHQKHGRTHRHVIWSRIDVMTMRPVRMTDDYEKHQATARQLEKLFQLEEVQSISGRKRGSGPRPARRLKTWESFRGQVSGIDPYEMKQIVTSLYRASRSGRQFVARLKEHGLSLVKGKHADFCLCDGAGHLHSLARRIDGVDIMALRELLRDVDLALPAI